MNHFKYLSVTLATSALAVSGCSSDGGGSSTSSGGTSSTPTGSSQTSSGSSSSSSSSSSSTSEGPGQGGGGTRSFGEDCTQKSECKTDKCVTFKDNSGQTRGFCSRTCTKSSDCPETGWVCNLSPHTACVPGK